MRSLFRLFRSTIYHPLNRTSPRRQFAALSRVLRWQLASRLLPEADVALPFVRRTGLVTNRGMVGSTGNWYGGLDEPQEMGLLLHLLRPGDVFVDIGANIGSFTILAASTGDVTCVAFEPVPATFKSLSRNVAYNAMGQSVQLRQQGISDSPGVLHFTTGLDSMNHVVLDDEAVGRTETVAVDVIRLDDAGIPAASGRMIFKIDVEGYELSVLKGAVATLRADSAFCVIMETNGSGARYGISDAEIINIMMDYGYSAYEYDPFARQFKATGSESAHINTIFLKDIAEARRRVEAAPAIELLNGGI